MNVIGNDPRPGRRMQVDHSRALASACT
jgi:hypothetical protein